MEINDLITKYSNCLNKYFYLLGETAKLPNLPQHIKHQQIKTLEELTNIANSLHYLFKPVLKEK